MKKVQIILLIFVIFKLCASANPKYKLEIKNAEGTDEQIVLVPGIFTKITLVLTELQTTNFLVDNYKYIITFNDEKIIPYQKTMTLEPKENLIYSNYIGLKCSESSDIDELTLNVEIAGYDSSSSPETLEYNAPTLKINKVKTTIKLDLLFKIMLQQSKNFFKLEDEIFNVEDISIKLNGISNYFKHDGIKIPSFANRNILSKDAPENHGILFDSPFFSDTILNSLDFDVNLELDLSGACFELLNSSFSFGINSEDVNTQIDDNVKAAIIYNTQDITPKFDISSNIQLSMNIPKAPVILECKFTVDAEALIGNDTLTSSEEDKIFKTIVTSTGKFDINIENLNVNGEYYAQCKISSTLIDELITNITINIGDFLKSDIIKKLIPSKDPNATPQCAKLTFENEQQANNFKYFGALFCSYYMKKDEPIISRVIPTIIHQVIEPYSSDKKPNQKILCVAPSALYHTAKSFTKKQTDFNDKFDSFLKELQNENSEYTMIKNIKVTKIEVEKDISINPESISVSLKEIKKLFVIKEFIFEIHNTHSQNLQCTYNKFFSSNPDSLLKYLNVSTEIGPNEKKEISVNPDITGFEANKFYTFYIKCQNLPNFYFKYETTGLMNKYSYYHTLQDISQLIDGITELTINCNEKKNLLNPRCLKDNFIPILDQLKTKIPTGIKDIEEEAKKFSTSSLDIKIKIIAEIEKNLNISKIIDETRGNIKTIIEKSMKLLKYLTYLDCSIYASGSTDSREKTIEGEIFLKCKESKTSIIDRIVDSLKNVLTCDNIERLINQQMLLSSEGESSFEDTIKYLFLFVNELTNNQEAISNSTIDYIIEMIECLEKNFDTIWEKLESILTNTYLQEAIKAIKRDLENIILQTLENLAKIIHFEEIDGMISVNITNNGIIIDAKMKLIYEKILDFSKKLLEFGSYNYTFSGSMLANVEIKNDNKQISADVDTQQKIISVQGKDILIITNSNIMFKDDNIQALQTLVFDSPIISAKTTANVEGNADALNLFVSITLYDKDGKEISLQNIDEKLRPQILYLKDKYQDLKQCFYYDDKKQNLITDGVNAVEKFVFQGQEYFKCVSSHLSEFTAGTAKKEGNKDNGNDDEGGSNTGLVVALVIVSIVVIALIIVGVIWFKKKNASSFYGSNGENKVKLVDM